jgi:quinone-modifying oxidoreductase subunit QmoC
MIATQWGLKDKLVGNRTSGCATTAATAPPFAPRGAQPGDVLAAVRAYAVQEYATPKVVAKMVADPKALPILLAIPAVIFIVVGLILKMFGITG